MVGQCGATTGDVEPNCSWPGNNLPVLAQSEIVARFGVLKELGLSRVRGYCHFTGSMDIAREALDGLYLSFCGR